MCIAFCFRRDLENAKKFIWANCKTPETVVTFLAQKCVDFNNCEDSMCEKLKFLAFFESW